jgi:protein Mpv17
VAILLSSCFVIVLKEDERWLVAVGAGFGALARGGGIRPAGGSGASDVDVGEASVWGARAPPHDTHTQTRLTLCLYNKVLDTFNHYLALVPRGPPADSVPFFFPVLALCFFLADARHRPLTRATKAMAAVSRAAIARAAATSCTMMALGDCITQEIARRRQQQQQQPHAPERAAAAGAAPKGGWRGGSGSGSGSGSGGTASADQPHDWARTARFAAIGAGLHGPFFAVGLAWLDRLYPGAASVRVVAAKILTGQLTLFPAYTTLFLATLRAMEGTPVAQLPSRLAAERASLAQTIARGSVFWPVVNAFTFTFCAGTTRIFAMNCAGIFWNSYLSYATQEKSGRRRGA